MCHFALLFAAHVELRSVVLSVFVCSLWKYLDELSESDPEGYKSFIQKQAANVKEDMEAKLDKRMEGKEPAMVIESRKADKVPAEPVSVHIWAAKDGEEGGDRAPPNAMPLSAQVAMQAG